MHCKSVSALLLLGVAVAAAAAAPPTVGAALSSRSDVQHFWQSLSLYPDIRQLISKTFSGTVFAPSNKAWDATMADVLPLTAEELKAIILYHIVPGPAAPLNKINDDQIFRTALPGTTVTAQYVDGKLTLEGAGSTATIIKPDILVGPADLAVVHVIDNVLLPTKAGSAGQPGSTGTVSATDLTAGTVGTTVDAVAGAVTGAVSNAVGTAQGALDTAQAATGAAGTAATDAAQQALDDAQQAVGGTSGAAGATPCPAIYLPVCSLANRTFDNACLANASNARIACQGECPCPAGTPILGEGAAAPAAGDGTGGSPCPLNYDPVCGTDGVTYGNECAAVAAKAEVECTRECPCNSPLAGPDAEAPGASDAPAAAPETAPAPEPEPEPAAAPESAPVPLSGASAASVSYVALAALAMLALLF